MARREGTQFSIYKIDYNEVKKHHTILFESDDFYGNKMRDFLLEEIWQGIKKRHRSEVIVVEKNKFKGIIYKTSHVPEWGEMASDLLVNEKQINTNKSDNWLQNINVSYVLLCVHNNDIYAMTGGFGSNVIRNYIEKNWGLYLVPKIVQKDSGIIRQIKENNMLGNASAISKANRKTTNISFEQDMSTIFRELSVELEREIAYKLGLKYDEYESPNKKTGFILKDSIVIRKNLILNELEKVIEAIALVEQEEDNFPLGYFLPVKKKGIKAGELMEKLVKCLLEGQFGDFQLVGDDYLSYYMIGSEYILTTETEEVYYSSAEVISLEDIFGVFEKEEKNISKHFINTFLRKWKISVYDADGGEVLAPMAIIDSIQGAVEYGENNIPCYILQGQWYCMDGQYTPILNEEFNTVYESILRESEQIKEKFGLCKQGLTEDDYNNSFFVDPNMIVAHTALISNFELADLIFYDDKYVYLMCNKKQFNGSGSRDLTNQIWASAVYFQNQTHSLKKTEFLKTWFGKIHNLYTKNNISTPINEVEFCDLFEQRNICYIAGYITGYDKESESLYAKYLSVDLNKKMYERGFKCISLSIE